MDPARIITHNLIADTGRESMYGFSINLQDNFEHVVERTTAALKEQGFGVLTDIDVQATLKAKLGEEMRPYRILGACSPSYAHQALSIEPEVGLLLPCNVVIRGEEDGTVKVSIVDPDAMLGVVDNPGMKELAAKVKERLLLVRDTLAEA